MNKKDELLDLLVPHNGDQGPGDDDDNPATQGSGGGQGG